MAAATEWLNALAAGAEVVSVRRREPARRPLNVARPLFTKRGLAGFRSAPRARRAELLRGFGEPSYPPGRSWDAPLEQAAREGRFRVEQELNGAEQVICATGFRRGFEHDPLLAGLVAEHGLETEERWIVLADDSTVPGADRRDANALARRRAGAVGLSGGRHARRDEDRGAQLPDEGRAMSYTLRGRRRDAARGGAAPVPRRRRALPDPAQVVAARAGRPDARRSDSRSTSSLYHRLLPYQPGWLALPLGVLELAATMAAATAARGERAALPRDRLLRRRVARAAGAGARRAAAAATHLARGRRRARPPRRGARRRRAGRGCSRSSGRPGPWSRRRSTSRPGSTRGRSSSTTRRR